MCDDLGPGALRPSLYAIAHGGALEDLGRRRRYPLEVQLRGRWRTLAPLQRYGKAKRLMTQRHKVEPHVLKYGTTIGDHLLKRFCRAAARGAVRVPAPPQPARGRGHVKARTPLARRRLKVAFRRAWRRNQVRPRWVAFDIGPRSQMGIRSAVAAWASWACASETARPFICCGLWSARQSTFESPAPQSSVCGARRDPHHE